MSQAGLTAEQIVVTLCDEFPYLVAEFGVSQIGLFGAYASGTPTEDSAVDMVVQFDPSAEFCLVELSEYLETVLGKGVRLIAAAGTPATGADEGTEPILEPATSVA
jgi:predicted nucleotidyltransferase